MSSQIKLLDKSMRKSFLLIPLALCLVFQSQYAAAEDGMMEKAAKDTLIKTACTAATSPQLCSSTLSTVANDPYLDPISITVTAVQAASKTAVATFDIINMSLTVDVQLLSDPAVRQSLSICAREYKSAIDNLDKAATSLTQKTDTPQVPTLLNTAIGSVTKCDSSGIKMTNKVVQIAAKNIDCTKLIKNALDIYQVFATYITNPEHDPKKGTAPVPNVGAGGAGAQIGGAVKGGVEAAAKAGAQATGGNVPAVLKGGNAAAPANLGSLRGGAFGAAVLKGGSAGAPANAKPPGGRK